MTPHEAMNRCQQLMSHAWMVRTFIKHSPECEDFPELMGIVRSVFDLSRALETQIENPEKYLLMLRRKLSKFKASVRQFREDATRISDHTNFKMAVQSIEVVTSDLEAILKACPVGPQAPPPVRLPGRVGESPIRPVAGPIRPETGKVPDRVDAEPASLAPQPRQERQVIDVDWLFEPDVSTGRRDATGRFRIRDWKVVEGCRVIVEDGLVVDVTTQPKGAPKNGRAMLPRLVNAHTHLEFSSLEEPFPAQREFAGWIRQVVASRQQQSVLPAESIRRGIEESRQAGVGVIGEIATNGWLEVLGETRSASWNASGNAATSPQRVTNARELQFVLFAEVLGFSRERQEQTLDRARRLAAGLRAADEKAVRFALSPHAPYTVPLDLLERVVDLSRSMGDVPVAMHLAESLEEIELLERGTGPLATMLQDFGLWQEGLFGGQSIDDYLDRMQSAACGLIIHGNYLTSAQMDRIQNQPQLSVVWCPRTHAAFGHAPYPLQELMSRGINVALGTDSRASNPDLSLWKEIQFIGSRFPEMSSLQLLELATENGFTALGYDLETSSGGLVPASKGQRPAWTCIQADQPSQLHPHVLHKTQIISWQG
ncbi:amidohydrolase [Planctopirus limnophila DSM 3776]|uniref:Amidohydrolase n=1 Tax=Planctopirus limnophila (strain ATCC 43296 / DSM 3776 / IFAM 1008 / Mu 290) TaxID=521674 RepID=D5STH3_PLAL2|nr:amidohydrolase family protein [Planctopirus limnophila]ADG69002.1 amidohydrolase [Planctopirus limnophila DSM 3776]